MSIYTKDQPNIINDSLTAIGDWTYGPLTISRAYGGCKLDVGKFCSLASGIQVMFLGRHQTDDISAYPFNILQGWPPVTGTLVEGQNVKIGNDVWIATGATIMQGTVIEDGAVIGAYSVVKTKIPAYSIAVGNPCKVIRKRFMDEQIAKLLEMQWWDWNIETIKKHLQLISSPNIDALYNIWLTEIKK